MLYQYRFFFGEGNTFTNTIVLDDEGPSLDTCKKIVLFHLEDIILFADYCPHKEFEFRNFQKKYQGAIFTEFRFEVIQLEQCLDCFFNPLTKLEVEIDFQKASYTKVSDIKIESFLTHNNEYIRKIAKGLLE